MLPLGLTLWLSLALALGEVAATEEEQRDAVELALPVLFWRLEVRRSAFKERKKSSLENKFAQICNNNPLKCIKFIKLKCFCANMWKLPEQLMEKMN